MTTRSEPPAPCRARQVASHALVAAGLLAVVLGWSGVAGADRPPGPTVAPPTVPAPSTSSTTSSTTRDGATTTTIGDGRQTTTTVSGGGAVPGGSGGTSGGGSGGGSGGSSGGTSGGTSGGGSGGGSGGTSGGDDAPVGFLTYGTWAALVVGGLLLAGGLVLAVLARRKRAEAQVDPLVRPPETQFPERTPVDAIPDEPTVTWGPADDATTTAAALAGGTLVGSVASPAGPDPLAPFGAPLTAAADADAAMAATPAQDAPGAASSEDEPLEAFEPTPADLAVGTGSPSDDAQLLDLVDDSGFSEAVAVGAGVLAGRVQRAAHDAVAGQLADDWAAADRRAASQSVAAVEARLRLLDGVEGADVSRWRRQLIERLGRPSSDAR